ncbi:P-loop NTPase fold protein [Shewanella sp. SR44-3]|uniref:P-loop NTPase fold protein n=1 Tax=Shewanella sp. SR44-3 TaxID=2760936 RepID=UPI0015FAFF36|nr:P-loop NTPase fold protein [Shewanella sp. SR44-3]MBB1269821.1 hypothetical protein [Shewanella sp. SR44-3]
MSKNTTQQIIDNLNDDSFPSILLLSGKWGCGKTHLAKNKVVPELMNKYDQAHYISLYGVSSLDDFRDKLVSLSYFNSKHSINNSSMIKNVIGNVAKGFGDKGATLALANSLAQPIKHKLLSKISNSAFVIDDLERVSSKTLASEVLGECLNLVENNINVAMLVLTNEEHIEDKSILEKTFNNKVILTSSPDEIVDVIREKYGRHLDDAISASAKEVISRLKISNYRIVLRAMQRFVPIKAQIEILHDVDKKVALSNVIKQVFAITYAHYEYGASFDEICQESTRHSSDRDKVFDSEDTPKNAVESPEERLACLRLKNIRHCISASTDDVTPALISYCLNITPMPVELAKDFNLPIQGKLLDRIKSFNFYDLIDEQFDAAVEETKNFLFDSTVEPKHFYDWFRVLNAYFFLVENEYIQGNVNDEYKRAKDMLDDPKALKPESPLHYHSVFFQDMHPKVDALYRLAKPSNDRLFIDIKQSELKKQFLDCWSTASSEISQNYDMKPFLHLFDAKEACQAFDHWTLRDIIEFGQFIESRYTISNIHEYLQDEFEFVRQLKEHLASKVVSMPASRLKGCLNLLIKNFLDKGVKLIEKAENYNRN